MEGLTEGRIVHYVLPTGRNKGAHRPAIVVRDWKQKNGLVQLQVFTDGSNDDLTENIVWRTSVHYDADKLPGTWHWIEKA
jgi:hypothetical protein